MARRPVSSRVTLAVALLAAATTLAAGQLSTGFGTVDTSPQAGGLAGNEPVSETPDGGRSHSASGELPPPGSPGFPGEEGPAAVPDGSGLLPSPEEVPASPPPPEIPGVPLLPKPGRRGRGGAAGGGPPAEPGAGVAVGHRSGDPEVYPEGLDPDAAAALQRAGLLGAGGRAASNLFVPAVGAVEGDDAPPADKAVRDGVDPFFNLDTDGDGDNDTYINPDGTIAGGAANYGKSHVKKRIQITLDSPGGPGDALVCHFPSGKKDSGGGVDPYNVRPLKLPAPAADLLLAKDSGNGFDFEAPLPGERVFGPGCVSYDSRCSFGNNGIPCSGHGICASTIPNTCLCMNGFKTCRNDSNGCETNVNLDPDNCGTCGRKCNTTATGGNEICCQGQCLDPAGTGGPTIACGRCGAVCATFPGVQNGSCTAGTCNVTCDPSAPRPLTVCPALQPGTGISLPICVDLAVNPLFCGNCSYSCPFDPNGLTRCGAFGPNATTACSVECSPSFPTQCGTLGTPSNPANNPDSGLRPTSNCVNLLTDPDNCGGCGRECPQSSNAITTCGISPVTGKPACSFACNPGLVPCTNAATGQPFCANIFGYDPFNCGGCGFVCSAGFTCFQGTCLPGFPYIGGGGGGFFGGSFFGGGGGFGFVDTKKLNGSSAAPGDERPAALRPPVISPARGSHGDVAVFPSYPEWWDNPEAAAAAGVPGAAEVAAGAPGAAGSKMAAYLAARPGLADGTLKLSTVLTQQHEEAVKSAQGGGAAKALPPNVDVAQCTWATADGADGGGAPTAAASPAPGAGKKGAAAKRPATLTPTAPPKPRVEVFLKASLPEGGAGAGADTDSSPRPDGKGERAGDRAASAAAAPIRRDRAAEAAAYGYGSPSPSAGVEDARFQTANILARQFEGQAAAAAGAGAAEPAAAAAPAPARKAAAAAPAAAPAAPPHAAHQAAGAVSVADGSSTVTARRAADAAGAAAGAAERAGVGSARAAAAAARGVVEKAEPAAVGGSGSGAFPKELGN